MAGQARATVSMRQRLLLVAIAGIVPVAIAAGFALLGLVRQVDRTTEAKALEITRVAAAAVNVELQQSIASLRSLAFSPLIDDAEFGRYRMLLERFVAEMPSWSSIALATPQRRVLVNTAMAEGTAIPPVFDAESFDQAVASRAPVVGRLLKRPDGHRGIAVRLPIVRGEELVYILTAVLRPEAILRLVESQHLPSDWILSVFDESGARVARSHNHATHVGGQASSTLVALMATGKPLGTGVTTSLEGTQIYTAYVRLPETGWAVAIGIPTAETAAATTQAVIVYGSGILASILIALFGGAIAARGITQPIEALKAAADRIGRGAIPPVPQTSIAELAALGRTLAEAATARERVEAERRAVSEERDALLESERAARAEAVRISQLKDEFIATLSHELRTPLNSILGWAQILRHSRASESDRVQGIDTIDRNARAQAKLIEELLDVNRISSGKVRLDLQSLEPAALLETAIGIARPSAEARQIEIDEYLDTTAGPILGDPARLQQVFGNLLSNAIKFTPPGGRIEVALRPVDGEVEITVADTGEGIEAEFLPHVFERFRQADASSTRRYGGLGLGLSIARDLVAMHGGSIRARSDGPGKGATFSVRLARTSRAMRLHAAASAPPPRTADLSGLRIVVVDDEADARTLASRILQDCGAEVTGAASAAAALTAIETHRPDVLVSDISMPDVDGYSLLRKVRALGAERGGSVPAIALTAYARPEDREQALLAGFAQHVTKPVEPAALVATVARIVQRPTVSAAPSEA